MHLSSYRHMERLVDRYYAHPQSQKIFDLGSYDVNGNYRELFNRPGWDYRGIDLSAGPNVDIVLKSAYSFPLPSECADLIISGQTFEHIDFFWITWLELVRVLKPCGMIFLIAPSRGPEHRYPVDCWRFYPDGFRALAHYAGLEIVEVSTDWEPSVDPPSAVWGDTVGVFKKGRTSVLKKMVDRLALVVNRARLAYINN